MNNFKVLKRGIALLSLVCALTISAFAVTDVIYYSIALTSSGIYINQTKCVNDSGTKVSAVYELYCVTTNDYTQTTLKGTTSGYVRPKSSNAGKQHKFQVVYGDGVDLDYTYRVQ